MLKYQVVDWSRIIISLLDHKPMGEYLNFDLDIFCVGFDKIQLTLFDLGIYHFAARDDKKQMCLWCRLDLLLWALYMLE